jgi:RsiW-degrading membrane proteinase PrsW (M82 family)
MQNNVCCVCGRQVGDAAARLGRRAYCEEHFAKVSHSRGSAWRSSLAYILALLVFTALVAVLADLTEPSLDGTALVLAGVGLSLIPAWLWLGFFYLQDTLEPEPKSYVLGVFALGALLATAVGIPILRDLFRVQDWLGLEVLSTVLGSILVVGFVQEFLKYAAVRYSVYPTAEFDERMDGILYGTAAGLGYATALNIAYVVSSGGVDLAMGCIRIVVTALAQASFLPGAGQIRGQAHLVVAAGTEHRGRVERLVSRTCGQRCTFRFLDVPDDYRPLARAGARHWFCNIDLGGSPGFDAPRQPAGSGRWHLPEFAVTGKCRREEGRGSA